jgi:hypothetical protein
MASIKIYDHRFKSPIEYFMEDKIKKALDEKVIPSLQKKDKDFLICIDGMEGGGKSTLAFQIGKYVDPTLNLSRVVFNAGDFREAIFKAKKGEVIIYDEAFTGLSSRASLSGVNRALVSLMMQMRQKNLCIILVLPTFFLLDKYAALFRARVLFHVYENKGIRGYFRVYSRKLKKLLYIYGKKDYSYPNSIRTKTKGRFYGVFALGDEEEEKKYRKKKAKALEDTEKDPMTAGQVKYREQRDVFIHLLRKQAGLTYQQMANLLQDYDIDMSFVQIRNICVKFGDKDDEKEPKSSQNNTKPSNLDDSGHETDEKEPIEPVLVDMKEEEWPFEEENDDFEDKFLEDDAF